MVFLEIISAIPENGSTTIKSTALYVEGEQVISAVYNLTSVAGEESHPIDISDFFSTHYETISPLVNEREYTAILTVTTEFDGVTTTSTSNSVVVTPSSGTSKKSDKSVNRVTDRNAYTSSLYQSHPTAAARNPQTHGYPASATPRLHNGGMSGLRPSPAQFRPGQEPVNANMYANSRMIYRRVYYEASPVVSKVMRPMDSSMRIALLKSRAVGKSGMKVGLPLDAVLSNKGGSTAGYTQSRVASLRRSGSAAPAKKGSLYR